MIKQRAKLCVILLTLMLGWHGLPGPGFCADYYQHEDFGEKKPGDVVSFTVTPPGTVTSGGVINPGGFIWFGGPATFTATIPTNFAGVHNGLFRGTWKRPPSPGPGPSRELTWEADTKAVVYKLTLQMDECLGISMVDPTNTPVDSETATATLTPAASATYSWTLDSITHFDPDPGSGNTATIKEQGVASSSYRNEKVKVSAKGLSAETNFTVVRIDIEIQGLGEADEEVVGGFIRLNSDDDNANGVPDLSEEPVTDENDLMEITITLYPSDLPADETVSLTGYGNLYEDPEKQTKALSSYPVSRFPLTLWVEGKSVSSEMRDKEVMVTHDASEAKDKVKYTVINADLEIYKPKVIDPTEPMIPDTSEMTTGSVMFVNLDNDDNDSKFDYNGAGTHDNIVTGGDDELVKVKLKIQPNSITNGQVNLLATEGAGNIAVWTNNEKSASSAYALGTVLNVPDDFTIEGDSLVKTLWVEGISAHTVQQGTKLKMKYTVESITCNDEASLTVVGVDQIIWKGKTNSVSDTSALDADPNWPGGLTPNSLRVFPDARIVVGSVEANPRKKVGVEVTLTVEPPHEIKVYLDSFDVDDPTSASTPVDDEAIPEDNRGPSPKAGQFIGESGGVKELVFHANTKTTNCDFQVTMQPGDNFRVVASGDNDFLLNLDNKDGDLHNGGGADPNADKQRIVNAGVKAGGGAPETWEVRHSANYCSKTLTVWRFLHVEVDSMTAPPSTGVEKNTVDGNITAVVGNGTVAQKVTLSVNLKTGLSPQDNSANLTAGTGNGRFENGSIKIGQTQTVVLKGNGDNYVQKDGGIDIPARVSKPGKPDVDGKVIAWSGLTFTLNITSDHLTGAYKGGTLNVAGVAMTVDKVNPGKKTVEVTALANIPFVIHDDDADTILSKLPDTGTISSAIQDAYILQKYDVGDTNMNVVFMLNVGCLNTNVIAAQDWDSKGMNSDRYWVAYVLESFQGDVSIDDHDPNGEGSAYGYTANPEGGCLIFLEVHRVAEGVSNPVSEEQDTVVHELGHAIGRVGVAAEPVTNGQSKYLEETLNYIRTAVRPWP